MQIFSGKQSRPSKSILKSVYCFSVSEEEQNQNRFEEAYLNS